MSILSVSLAYLYMLKKGVTCLSGHSLVSASLTAPAKGEIKGVKNFLMSEQAFFWPRGPTRAWEQYKNIFFACIGSEVLL